MMARRAAAWMSCAVVLIASLATPAAANTASEEAFDGDWHFSLSPYAWIPGVTSDLHYRIRGKEGDASVHLSASELLSHLKFGFMGMADARKGEWSGFTDLIYANLGAMKARVRILTGPAGLVEIPINIGTKASLQEGILTFGIGRAIYHDDGSWADGFVGMRWLGAKSVLDFSFAGPLTLLPISGRLSDSGNLWDLVAGVRGRYRIRSSAWFLKYYGDVGTGESQLTGQIAVGPGYAFDWGDLYLGFRYLHYTLGVRERLITGLDMYGPTIGATFYL